MEKERATRFETPEKTTGIRRRRVRIFFARCKSKNIHQLEMFVARCVVRVRTTSRDRDSIRIVRSRAVRESIAINIYGMKRVYLFTFLHLQLRTRARAIQQYESSLFLWSRRRIRLAPSRARAHHHLTKTDTPTATTSKEVDFTSFPTSSHTSA